MADKKDVLGGLMNYGEPKGKPEPDATIASSEWESAERMARQLIYAAVAQPVREIHAADGSTEYQPAEPTLVAKWAWSVVRAHYVELNWLKKVG